MKKSLIIIAALLILAGIGPGTARSQNVILLYSASEPLRDENFNILEDGFLIQLIHTTDPGWPSPPSVYNARPTGGDVLWQTSSIGDGMFDPDTGRFVLQYEYPAEFLGDYVYVRFFNAPMGPQISFYGQTPLHQLQEGIIPIDLWDVTDGGLYLWTEYPFMIIPEPTTWLTLLPGLALAAFIFRKKRSREAEST